MPFGGDFGILGRTMAKYDLTVLIDSGVKDQEKDAFVARMEKLVGVMQGKLGKLTEMGRKQLAYPINKQSEAQYMWWSLELPSTAVVEFEKKLNNDKEVMRHLLVKVN